MKKFFLITLLTMMVFLNFCSRKIEPVLDPTPPITFQVDGTFTMTGYTDLGDPVLFTIPYPVTISIESQITGAPPKTTFGVILIATGNGCPSGHIKYDGKCYSSDAVHDSQPVTEKMLLENGRSWKVQPIIYWGPRGKAALKGNLIVRFSKIQKPQEPEGGRH